MGKITIQGDNSPTGILRHWERKTKQDCAREILRCWTERDTLRQQLEQAEARVAMLEHFCDAVLSDLEIMDESEGVAGWHLNGEIATWAEVGLTDTREGLIAARKKSNAQTFILRKQAEALEAAWHGYSRESSEEDCRVFYRDDMEDCVQRLHQQADAAEKEGGDS